jgi:hypothetical protein
MWVDPETGEASEDCPNCADLEDQVRGLEMEARRFRTKITQLKNAAEADVVAKRDKSTWATILGEWKRTFPERRTSATSIKSASATKAFMRLEAGATVDDVLCAIRAAKTYPHIVYGRRVKTGSKSDLSVGIQEILSVNNDANFDFLVEVGRSLVPE